MKTYLERFDKVRFRLAPLLENLGGEIGKGLEMDRAKLGHFVKEVREIRAEFAPLQPPPILKRVHRAFDRVLKAHEKLAGCVAGYLKTGNLAYFDAMVHELPNIEDLSRRFYKETQRGG